jgi:hypothetical protein
MYVDKNVSENKLNISSHCHSKSFFSSRATTHTDLVLRAKRRGIEYKVIHNASIMNAVACCGLQVLAEVFIVYFILYHNVEKC